MIINGNAGSVQTTDLSVEAGKDIWIVVTDPENAAVTYEEPAAAPVPEETEAPATEAPAAEAPAEQPAEKSGSNTGAIIGAVAAVAVIGGGAAVAIKKKKK